ncbi:MAG: dihydroneopterin aldolase [Chloroflexi bacterium]|nr:dihydroneopterin aldolase [Chloroflexota bacterium]
MACDRVFIQDLLLRTIIGVKEEERQRPQDVLINLVLYTDTRPAGTSDDLRDAVDYAQVARQVGALVEGSRFFLVEKLAEEIAALCLQDSRVYAVDVRVEKPGAVRFARSVGVAIHRRR